MSSTEVAVAPEKKERVDLGKQIINFMGPEGCGKTTIAKRLLEESGKPYITIGDILRDMATNDQTKYGDECRAMLVEHRYLNPEMLLDILVKRFGQEDTTDGFILDGGLRTVREIEGCQSVLDKAGRIMPLTTIHLRVPGWMGAQRLTKDETARGRSDDAVDAVLSRLSRYYDHLGQRATLIKNQENWKLIHVDATGNPEVSFNNVVQVLKK